MPVSPTYRPVSDNSPSAHPCRCGVTDERKLTWKTRKVETAKMQRCKQTCFTYICDGDGDNTPRLTTVSPAPHHVNRALDGRFTHLQLPTASRLQPVSLAPPRKSYFVEGVCGGGLVWTRWLEQGSRNARPASGWASRGMSVGKSGGGDATHVENYNTFHLALGSPGRSALVRRVSLRSRVSPEAADVILFCCPGIMCWTGMISNTYERRHHERDSDTQQVM